MCKIVVQLEERGIINEQSYLDAVKRAARNAPTSTSRSGISIQIPKGKKKLKKHLCFKDVVNGYKNFRSCIKLVRQGQCLIFRIDTGRTSKEVGLFVKGLIESMGWDILKFQP